MQSASLPSHYGEIETAIESGVASLPVSESVVDRAVDVLRPFIHDVSDAVGVECIAAGAVYAGCLLEKEKQRQADVADVFGVGEVSVRKYYQEMLDANDEQCSDPELVSRMRVLRP